MNWGAIHYRKLVLNAIAWIAKVDIPQGGLNPGNVSVADLQENQDYPPKNWNAEDIKRALSQFNDQLK